MEESGRRLRALGAPWVLVKGGHLAGAPVDLLIHAEGRREFRGKRFDGEVHGTGCALSSAIAAGLAAGLEMPEAVARAHAYLQAAIARSEPRGRGSRILDYGAPY
jgi:hydroxymethylpyrimidine/phosphomethylpyrimidine kinase